MTSPDRSYGVPGDFSIARCRSCGHVFMNPMPTDASALECYPVDYFPHASDGIAQQPEARSDAAQTSAPRPWYLSRWVRSIPGLRPLYYALRETRSEVIPDVDIEQPRAVEIGCATGNFLRRLQDCGWDVQGIEPVEGAAQKARSAGFNVHIGDLFSARLPSESFHGAFAWMVLEHLTRPRETLREIHRILRPSGYLAFSVPNFGTWERRFFGRDWYALDLPRHLQHYTPQSIRRLLRETGFDRVQIIHQRNLLNVSGSLGLRLQSKWPHSRLAAALFRYADSPTMWGQLALSPAAILLAALRQGGRITVMARRQAP